MSTRSSMVLACLCLVGGCAASQPAVTTRPRAGGTDVTFFVAADTHFGATESIEALNRRQVEAMNALPGTPVPAAVGQWVVAEPRGVLMAGDLTDHGLAREWKQFAAVYGRDGTDGLLRYPLYEGTGNHDRHVPLLRPVLDAVRRRHGGLTYSWDWADVHLVCLDEYPDAANRRWLERDLAAVGRHRPVVIYFHFNLVGPFSQWWPQREKEAFARAIDGYNVVGIFHGHFHWSGRYAWKGRDVYNVGSPRHAWHSFAVVRITDTSMTVCSWDWERGAWKWWHGKEINTAASPSPPRGSAPRGCATRPAGR
jgi:hypothetical protein